MSLTQDILTPLSPRTAELYHKSKLLTDHNTTVGQGIRFECQPGCTECCRQQGFVYLSEADLLRAATFVGMSAAAFERKYVYRTQNRMRLRVPRRAHCHFLVEGGCGLLAWIKTVC